MAYLAMSKIINLIVATDPKYPIRETAEQLAKGGFIVQDIHDAVDCIIGSADESFIQSLKQTKGVLDVSTDIHIEIPSPANGETW